MSTRCQVMVIQEGIGWKERVSLYHHSDGYPSHVIKDIVKTYETMMSPKTYGPGLATMEEWKAGRAGSVAAYLCATHPAGFEPEDSHELHGDIEYHYTLYVVNHKQGCVGDIPTWDVEIREPGENFDATLGTMKLTTTRSSLEEVAKQFCKTEKVK